MDWSFARRPLWIVSHIAVLCLIVSMIGLGVWQLNRLSQKKELAAQILARRDQPAVPVQSLSGVGQKDLDAVRYRTVTATGRFEADEQVFIRNRSLDGQPGSWLVAPIRLSDDTLVLVLRGWVSVQSGPELPTDPSLAPPEGEVIVRGGLMRSEQAGRFGGTDDPAGRKNSFKRLTSEGIGEQLDAPVRSGFIQLTDQDPPLSGDDLVLVPLPEPSEGPHFSYAVQWFVFTAIAIIGYPIVLRNQARGGRSVGKSAVPEWES